MTHEKTQKLLKLISQKIDRDWMLIGSTNHALQGVDLDARDIDLCVKENAIETMVNALKEIMLGSDEDYTVDILTNKEGAELAGRLLKDFCKDSVEFEEYAVFRSYHGVFKINNSMLEIKGNLKLIKDDYYLWKSLSHFDKKVDVNINGQTIPCLSLKQEQKVYSETGREKRAEQIRKVLEKKLEKN